MRNYKIVRQSEVMWFGWESNLCVAQLSLQHINSNLGKIASQLLLLLLLLDMSEELRSETELCATQSLQCVLCLHTWH